MPRVLGKGLPREGYFQTRKQAGCALPVRPLSGENVRGQAEKGRRLKHNARAAFQETLVSTSGP